MSANKFMVRTGLSLALCLAGSVAWAVQGLEARSQTKVNNAMAKAWQKGGSSQNDPALQKQVVNIGSKRGGTCNVNVGTAKAGEKAPKEIVVTTKEVINVCK